MRKTLPFDRSGASVHPTASLEAGVRVGPGTVIWDHVHIRHSSTIGQNCIIGEKSYIAYNVHVGNLVKINAFAYICTGVTIEDGVMVSADVVFTNDRYPRAATSDLRRLRPSEPDDATFCTVVREGATIGASSTIGCDLTIGRFAMVGMGSVVTKTVPDFSLVLGNPARRVGYVCRCGHPLVAAEANHRTKSKRLRCRSCKLMYQLTKRGVKELFSFK